MGLLILIAIAIYFWNPDDSSSKEEKRRRTRKPYKSDTSFYDYEQFLKGNGK